VDAYAKTTLTGQNAAMALLQRKVLVHS